MKLLNNIRTLTTSPGMLRRWSRWNLSHLGITPTFALPGGETISGFRNFSEFWAADAIAPTDEELLFLEKFAGKSGVMLDVGGNLGCFSLTMARMRPQCVVHAFEPSPQTRSRLEANIAQNHKSNVKIHPLALGKAPGKMSFLNNQVSPGTSRLVAGAERPPEDAIEVTVSTVDAFLESIGSPEVAFIKIDVEGFEASVLRGAESTLRNRRCRAGLLELCAPQLDKVGSSVQELIDVLKQVSWGLHFLLPDGTLGDAVTDKTGRAAGLTNIVMLPEEMLR